MTGSHARKAAAEKVWKFALGASDPAEAAFGAPPRALSRRPAAACPIQVDKCAEACPNTDNERATRSKHLGEQALHRARRRRPAFSCRDGRAGTP